MNFYDRVKDEWYDEKIQNIFYRLSREKNDIKSSNFYIKTNKETTYDVDDYGEYYLILDKRTPLKIILNASYKGVLYVDYDFLIYSVDENGEYLDILYGKENTIIYTIDVSNEKCYDFILIMKSFGEELKFNNVTIEYKESFSIVYYKAYKSEILKEIN